MSFHAKHQHLTRTPVDTSPTRAHGPTDERERARAREGERGRRALTGCLDSAVVVRVDADFLVVATEGELAEVQRLQLVVALQVRPAPYSAVDYVRQALSVGDLEPPVQTARDGDALGGGAGLRESPLELLQRPLLLLELLDEGVDGLLGPLLVLVALLPAQQTLDCGRRKRYHGRHLGETFKLPRRL